MSAKENRDLYNELFRPQFHFTPKKDWMNDPNGLVYYKGEYHLMFQHSPGSVRHAPNTWGHAVSTDLVHWKQIEDALIPDEYGWIWSGSAVVDWGNTAGFKKGKEDTIVAIYTTGGFGDPPNLCVQSIAYSNNCGRTFTKYDGNPVLERVRKRNRDPKVIRHKPTKKWIMALWLDEHIYALFASENLKSWEYLSEVIIEGSMECADIFELPVDGDPRNTRWVLWGGAGIYRIGAFDGRTFTPESPAVRSEYGPNGYAAQTWSDIPGEDGRTIQISWMSGGRYPGMPFNQQMSFPVELSLKSTPDGIRLYRTPVREIELLHGRRHEWNDLTLSAGFDLRELFRRYGPGRRKHMNDEHANLIPDTSWDLFDIRIKVELKDASAFGCLIHGNDLCYEVAGKKLTFLDRGIPVVPDNDGCISMRLLADRTSLEIFVAGGGVSASFCFLPDAPNYPLEFYAKEGGVRFASLTIYELESAWE